MKLHIITQGGDKVAETGEMKMSITTYATTQGLYTVCVNSTRRALISNAGGGRWFLYEVTPENQLVNNPRIDVTRQLHNTEELNKTISEFLQIH